MDARPSPTWPSNEAQTGHKIWPSSKHQLPSPHQWHEPNCASPASAKGPACMACSNSFFLPRAFMPSPTVPSAGPGNQEPTCTKLLRETHEPHAQPFFPAVTSSSTGSLHDLAIVSSPSAGLHVQLPRQPTPRNLTLHQPHLSHPLPAKPTSSPLARPFHRPTLPW